MAVDRAGKDGVIRLRDNFGGRAPVWHPATQSVVKSGDVFEIALKRGESVEATLAAPSEPPPAPTDAAEPLVSTVISPTKLPLHLGADSEGENRFVGEMARPMVVSRALDAAEISKLANPDTADWEPTPVAVWSAARNLATAHTVGELGKPAGESAPPGPPLVFTGAGFVRIPNQKALDCPQGITLSVWIKPGATPPGGARLFDKSKVGTASGYLLDTCPGGGSLRLITREPAVIARDVLQTGRWSHVAATVTADGVQTIYLDGNPVATSD